MTTIMPGLLGIAQLMTGCPCTESGEAMPLASWYRISSTASAESYVAVTSRAVYQCNSVGRIHDFFYCLYQRRAVDTREDALRHIGFGLAGGSR